MNIKLIDVWNKTVNVTQWHILVSPKQLQLDDFKFENLWKVTYSWRRVVLIYLGCIISDILNNSLTDPEYSKNETSIIPVRSCLVLFCDFKIFPDIQYLLDYNPREVSWDKKVESSADIKI